MPSLRVVKGSPWHLLSTLYLFIFKKSGNILEPSGTKKCLYLYQINLHRFDTLIASGVLTYQVIYHKWATRKFVNPSELSQGCQRVTVADTEYSVLVLLSVLLVAA